MSPEDVARLKEIMQTKAGLGFSYNVLKIALNLQEEKMAA